MRMNVIEGTRVAMKAMPQSGNTLVHSIGRRNVFGRYYRLHRHATHKLCQASEICRPYHTTTSPIYKGLDLASNEIRVIKIQPGQWEDDIVCRLEVGSLIWLLGTKYDALSYTWGDSTDRRTIKINAQSTDISANLFMALRALRRRFTTATIWADALCINQTDNSEKSKQVALMGRIYKQSKRTWVSLGCPDENWADGRWSPAPYLRKTEKAYFLTSLFRGPWRLLSHHLLFRRSRRSRLGVNHVSEALRLMTNVSFEDNPDILAQYNQRAAASMLTWLATNDYWTRVWIVQEVALSLKDPICIFGRYQVPLLSLDTILGDWATGFSLATSLSEWADATSRFKQRRVSWSPEVAKGASRAQEICMLRDEYLTMRSLRFTGTMEPLRALQLASHRRASIAHDHVFGLRSLLPDKEQELLQPDYSLSIRELFASVTKRLLRRGYSISLLCAAVGTSQRDEHKLPSWSLDFSQPLKLPFLEARTKDVGEIDEDGSSEFGVLHVRGKPIGERIDKSALKAHMQYDLLTNSSTVSNFLKRDIYEVDRRGTEIVQNREDLDEVQRHSSGFGETSADLINNARHDTAPRDEQDQGEVVFSTDQGDFGKCPNKVQLHDEIWTLVGSEVTFVLRPMSNDDGRPQARDRYMLVGPCVIFGLPSDTSHILPYEIRSIEIV